MNIQTEGMNLIAYDMWREVRRARDDNALPMLVVYDRPNDFPERVVVRLFVITSGTVRDAIRPDRCWTFRDLECARASRPPKLATLRRCPEDDEKIVEVWL